MRPPLAIFALVLSCAGDQTPDPPLGVEPPPFCSSRSVDLLFVLDTTEGTAPLLAETLTSLRPFFVALDQGDLTLDGIADFAPIEDIRVAVTTMSRHIPGLEFLDCPASEGPLLTSTVETPVECEEWPAEYLQVVDPWDAARQVQCLAGLHTSGCPIRQPLAAIRDAMDRPGVFREDSLIVAIVVTRGDDCSIADLTAFDPERDLGNLLARCWTQAAALSSVPSALPEESQLRRTLTMLVAGVPGDLISPSGDLSSSEDPRLVYQEDEEHPPFALPVCRPASLSPAYAPERLLQFSRETSFRSYASVCDYSDGRMPEQWAGAIVRALEDACVTVPGR